MSIKKYLAFVIICIVAVSCKKTPTETNSLFKYRDYISYTSSGLVSVADPIRISLADAVTGWEEGPEITEHLIDITPHASGKLSALNKHTLIFIPDEPLNPDTEYTVTVKLGDIYKDIPKEFKTYTFQFKTIKPNFNISTNNLQSYSKEWQYLEAVISSADVITLAQAKQLVKASQNGKTLSLVFNEINQRAKVFEFRVDSINRLAEDSYIEVSWNGQPIKANNKGSNKVTIPGVNNFSVVGIKVEQYPDQVLRINFSDPLKKDQNLDGLVSLENVDNPKFIVNGNVLNVYPSNKLTGTTKVEIFQGIANQYGYKLKTPFSELILFESLKPQVRLISNGSILPNSQELKFNFEAVNLSAVDVRIIKIFEDNILQFLQDNALSSNNEYALKKVGRRIAKQTIPLVANPSENTGEFKAYSLDLSHYFKAEPGAIYRVELSYKKAYSLYNCDANATTSTNPEDDFYNDSSDIATPEDEDLKEEAYWDNLAYSYRNDHYNWNERNNPCHDAYYNESRVVAQNLIASNLGVIAKRGANNSYYFAVTNLLNTKPEANAKVTLYNYQQQELYSAFTDADGLTRFKADKQAAFAIVTKGHNKSYLRLFDGNALSLSKFDITGHQLQRGLKGYIYGERGVWRPGDTLFLTFMLNDKSNKLPKGHPVKMQVTDPFGKLVYNHITANHENNFYKFVVPTSTNYKTGVYNAKVAVGGAIFDKPLQIESIKPNRLKINIDFNDKILTKNQPLDGTLSVNWLHGTPGKNLKVDVKAKFNTSYAGFKNYTDYTFIDPTRAFANEEVTLFEGNVNTEGQATMNQTLEVGKDAPGMLNVQFLVRAFENGGDFSIDAVSKPYAPYASFVGLKSPKEDSYGSFNTDNNHTFNLVVVNKDGHPLQRQNLEINVYKIEWRWWWDSSYDNLSSYVSSNYHKPIINNRVNTNAKGVADFTINIPENEAGRYLIRITDPVSGHATGRVAYFYKNWWEKAPNQDKDAAAMLVFASDKETYNVGETAKVTFQSGAEGRALISIENGTEVLDYKWVKTQAGETTIDIPISAAMAPNVFINISLLQPHAITANDLPIRLYGVIPIMVEDPKTKLEPLLKMPDVLKPEQAFEISVSERNNKPMTYTIALVEEGLLDLTRFKTPNAWEAFYKREALGVRTWDIFNDVIGAYSGSIDQVFAIGGDGSALAGKNQKANRFKPVVTYLGPFTLEARKTQTHTLKLPNYIGSVRAMIVAGDNDTEAYGSTDKTVPVKKPLMVLSTLPRKISNGEKVTLPVTVFAMEPHIKNVNLSLKLSQGVTAIGQTNTTVAFSKPEEKMAYFELDFSKTQGTQTVEIIAKGHGETATYKVELDVVNPNPITSKITRETLEANTSKSVTISTFGEGDSNSASVEFSTLPPMDFTGRLDYLIQYPHGCLEQTTSSAFPQLYLSSIFDLTYDKKQTIKNNIEKTIERISNFQQPNGGLSYWMGENTTDDWSTSYAGHFMIEAANKGYVLPLTFKSNWIAYQNEAARNWRPSYKHYLSDLAQAYRLYTLALAGKPNLAAMNRLREFSEISNEAKWRLAAAYALAGQTEASEALIKTANINFTSAKGDYYTYGSVDRNRAMALETMVIIKSSKTRELAESIAKRLSGNSWMSTQTTAYSLLALAKMVEANGGKDLDLSYTVNGKTQTVTTNKAISLRELNIKKGTYTLSFTNNKENLVYISILTSGKLPLGEALTEQRGLAISTNYKDLQGNPISIDKLQQGQDFVASIKVSNLKNEPINNVALSQIFPSGWEIINTRFTAFGNTIKSDARYTDIRDDRVNFYFDLGKKGTQGTKTFTVLLNAAYLGNYYLPGTQAEAMYDHDYLVRTQGKWVTIEQQ